MMQRFEAFYTDKSGVEHECDICRPAEFGTWVGAVDALDLEAENAALREKLTTAEANSEKFQSLCTAYEKLHATMGKRQQLKDFLAAAEARTVLSPEQIVSMPAYKKLQRAMTPDDKTCASLAGEFARAALAASAAPAAQEDAKDAARYRWLLDNPDVAEYSDSFYDRSSLGPNATVSDAIDAAIAANTPKET